MRSVINAQVISYSDPKLGGTAANYVGQLMGSLDVTGSIDQRLADATVKAACRLRCQWRSRFGPIRSPRSCRTRVLSLCAPADIQFYTEYAAGEVMAASAHQDVDKALDRLFVDASRFGGHEVCERLHAVLEHDAESLAADLIRGGNRFSGRIMLKQKVKLLSAPRGEPDRSNVSSLSGTGAEQEALRQLASGARRSASCSVALTPSAAVSMSSARPEAFATRYDRSVSGWLVML